jgi:PKD repeat protein
MSEVEAENIAPVADVEFSTDFLEVAVSGEGSKDEDGSIALYEWNFGDGNTATGPTATHTYENAGTYTVSLKVTDDEGKTDHRSVEVTVVANQAPVADVDVSENYLEVNVSGEGSNDVDGTIESYEWDFGDGNTATGMTASHTYGVRGRYTIELTVTDDRGLVGIEEVNVRVEAENIAPVADVEFSTDFLEVAVSGEGSKDEDGSIALYEWDFGDGNTATGPTATHTYENAGTYTVSLKVTDDEGKTDHRSVEVTVVANQAPVADVDVSENYLEVNVSGEGSNDVDGTIESYEWDFGDGNTATGMTASHTYGVEGTYTIELTVTDDRGLTGVKNVNVEVEAENIAPVADVEFSTDFLEVAVSGEGSKDEDGSIALYEWNFGDGNTATGSTATHTYENAGTYTVSLKVTDNKGAQSETSVDVEIQQAKIKPYAEISYTRDGNDFIFEARNSHDADGQIVLYEWSFGDGGMAEGQIVTHRYNSEGSMIVSLRIVDNDEQSYTTSLEVVVEFSNSPPIADFNIVIDGLEILVDASASIDGDGEIIRYEWNFGDGYESIGQKASHRFTSLGNYNVELTVTDNDGASSSKRVEIVLGENNSPPNAEINYLIKDLFVVFDAYSSKDADGDIQKFVWDFGDGNQAEGVSVSHQYPRYDTYEVTLTAIDKFGASDKDVKILVLMDENDMKLNKPKQLKLRSNNKHVQISWRDENKNEQGFYIEKAEQFKGQAKPKEKDWSRIAQVGKDVEFYEDKIDKVGTYHYRIIAFSREGLLLSEPSNSKHIKISKLEPDRKRSIFRKPAFRQLVFKYIVTSLYRAITEKDKGEQPSSLEIDRVRDGLVKITWFKGSGDAVEYVLERGKKVDRTTYKWEEVQKINDGQGSTREQLESGEYAYRFRIVYRNSKGTVYTNFNVVKIE